VTAPADRWLEAVESLVQARIGEDRDATADALVRLAAIPTPIVVRKSPSLRSQAQVFARDSYSCRYCGRRVVLTAVLRLLHRAHPGVIPYNTNWRPDATHPAFAALSATLDHVVPVALGGDSLDQSNLVCACWSCNLQKSALPLDSLGWKLMNAQTDADWDGLSSLYEPLWVALDRPELGANERGWMRAVEAARHAPV
jgi:5-methylcytosine-specific restriction endonuclease McrA